MYPEKLLKARARPPATALAFQSNQPALVSVVKIEADGLRANPTWEDETVFLLSDSARQEHRRIKIAELLALCGTKFHEMPEQQWKYKGLTCHTGDNTLDAHGNHVLSEETTTTPTFPVTLNLALFFGCRAVTRSVSQMPSRHSCRLSCRKQGNPILG